MRTTVIFDNLGPYHRARLRAAAKVSTLTAIQVSARSAVYAWENETAADAFELTTLFPQGDSRQIPANEVVRRVHSALDTSRPEVVFIPGWSSRPSLAALLWCSRHAVPAVVMSESTAWDEARVGWKEKIKRRLVTLFAAALVGGRPHADYAIQLGLPPDHVFCGYDAVDNAYFWQRAAEVRTHDPATRRQQGLPPAYFLASARFIEKKNLPRLLQAYARYRSLCGNEVPWSLVLLGDGELKPTLLAQVDALNLRDHVLLPGFRQYPELPDYYACASTFIHASTVEPWGLVVNEAMASGLPVLVSDRCGCASDLVQNGSNGFTFDPLDVNELARRMHQISALSPEDRNVLGAESGRIISEWCPDRFGHALAQAAAKAMESGPVRKATLLDQFLCLALLKR